MQFRKLIRICMASRIYPANSNYIIYILHRSRRARTSLVVTPNYGKHPPPLHNALQYRTITSLNFHPCLPFPTNYQQFAFFHLEKFRPHLKLSRKYQSEYKYSAPAYIISKVAGRGLICLAGEFHRCFAVTRGNADVMMPQAAAASAGLFSAS